MFVSLRHQYHFSSFQTGETNSGTPIAIPLPLFRHLFSFFNIFSPIIIISLIPFPVYISEFTHLSFCLPPFSLKDVLMNI